MTPADHAAIFSYENKPAMQMESDAESDQKLITSGIVAKCELVAQRRPNLTCFYTPSSDFTGSFVMEVHVSAKSDIEALSALYVELSVVLTRLLNMCAEMRTGGEK